MAAQKWQPDSPLAERLFAEFYRFSFFKAVDLLESLSPDKTPLGQALVPADEAVRFLAKASLAFPPSDISALGQAHGDQQAKMEVAFLGLIGPSGVLPYWYTELVQERLQQKDAALKDFLDMFQHRLVSLFYLAWKKHRFVVNYQAGAKDRLSRHLLSLSGLGTAGLAERIGVPGEDLDFYSGHFSKSIPSAVAIEASVEHFSGVPAGVEQFIERALPLEPGDQTQIGSINGQLGVDTVVGSQVMECQTKFRLKLGPLTFHEFQRFLPGRDVLKSLFALVKYMVGIEYEFEIRLILKRKEIPPCILGAKGTNAPQLGWTTWAKAAGARAAGARAAEDPYLTFAEADLPRYAA